MTLQQNLIALIHESADDARRQLHLEPGVRIAVRAAEVLVVGFINRSFARYQILHTLEGESVTPYPTTVDLSAYLMDAMAFFRGTGDKAKVVHDSWEATGYGLGKYLPDATASGSKPTFAAHPSFMTMNNAECADVIEKALNETPNRAAAVGSPDWHGLWQLAIQAALKIIQQWLGITV